LKGQVLPICSQQRVVQPVHRRRIVGGIEARLASRIGGDGMGPEVMVERIVLLENHNEMRRWGPKPSVRSGWAKSPKHLPLAAATPGSPGGE
jgi:hypothetical protein